MENKAGIETGAKIAQILTALVAIAGFVYALHQGQRTAELILEAQEGFRALAVPLVVFERYQWITSPKGMTCKNPPSGVNVYIRNMSGIPVALDKFSVTIRIGDRIIVQPTDAEKTIGGEGGAIIPAGGATSQGLISNAISENYPRLQGDSDPHMSFDLVADYHTLTTHRYFKYSSRITLLEDCRIPGQRRYSKYREKFDAIP